MMPTHDRPQLKSDFKHASAKRQRRKKPPVTRALSVRLSDDERATLEKEAGKLSLSAHVRRRLLGGSVSGRRGKVPSRKRRIPTVDHVALGKTLALLGQAELSRRLDELAVAAMMGALPVTPELVQELHAVCAYIREMRKSLMEALNIKRGFEDDTGR